MRISSFSALNLPAVAAVYRRGHGQRGPEDGQAAAADHQEEVPQQDRPHHRPQVDTVPSRSVSVSRPLSPLLTGCVCRINTIMDCERVLVLRAGRVVEFDSPAALCRSEGSVLHRLVGPRAEAAHSSGSSP